MYACVAFDIIKAIHIEYNTGLWKTENEGFKSYQIAMAKPSSGKTFRFRV